MIKVNEEAPIFKAKAFWNDEIVEVDLENYRGKWVVLFFYPADFTFVCPTELGKLAERYEEIRGIGAEVLSVSTDSVFVHKAWHNHSETIKKIKFPMVADSSGAIAKDYECYIEEGDDAGLSLRASVIIDPEGIVKCYEVNTNGVGRSINELVRKLKAVKFVREHGDEVCPVEWDVGQKTLKPGLDLVGKI